ncbi:MAG: response regulator [Flavobacteriales bacterium]|nr:response regulator [Flavobacteriales bacterium]
MEEEKVHVLYVDDEEHNLNAFKASFRRDFKVYIAESAAVAKDILANNEIHVLITDQRMPVTTGSELLKEAVKINPDQIRILLTGYSDLDAVTDAVNNGKIYKYIQKPWDDNELREVIKEAYSLYKSIKAKEDLTKKLMLTNEQLEFYLRQKLLS